MKQVKSLEDAINDWKSIVSQKHVKITPLCDESFQKSVFQNPVRITLLCQFHCVRFDRTNV